MKFKKILLIGASALSISTVALPLATQSVAFASTNNTEIEGQFNDFSSLSSEKQKEFIELVESKQFSDAELQDLLNQYLIERSEKENRGVKTSAIKKLAKWLAAKVGAKSIADITDYLFEWQDDLQQGAENFLVQHSWNRSAAHWTVKSIMFVLF